jgi:hypothetical protein
VFRDAIDEVATRLHKPLQGAHVNHMHTQQGIAHLLSEYANSYIIWRHATSALIRIFILTEESISASKYFIESHPLPEPLLRVNISDGVQCYTEFEPRSLRNHSISEIALSGLATSQQEVFESGNFEDWKQSSGRGGGMLFTAMFTALFTNYSQAQFIYYPVFCTLDGIGWHRLVLDNTDVLISHIPLGLRDHKCVLCGNKQSGPLSLHIAVLAATGHVSDSYIRSTLHCMCPKIVCYDDNRYFCVNLQVCGVILRSGRIYGSLASRSF